MKSVFVLTSPNYTDLPVVGVFGTEADAEWYRTNAVPPITDGVVTEYTVESPVNLGSYGPGDDLA